MANQYDTKKFKVGDVFGDYTIVSLENKPNDSHQFYLLECNICSRQPAILPMRVIRLRMREDKMVHGDYCSQIIHCDERFRRIYFAMRSRTTNPNTIRWDLYEKISSDHYENFVTFYDDMYVSYIKHVEMFGEENTTLDRIDPSGDYVPDNIRWATCQTQSENQKRHKGVVVTWLNTGETEEFKTLKRLADFLNIEYQKFYKYYKRTNGNCVKFNCKIERL
jgi:hypothetical protein